VQVPEWLLEILLEGSPPDERSPDRPLFGWPLDVGHPRQKVEKLIAKACMAAGIPHYHPHDLRHRRITLWHGQGIPAREIGARVGQQQISTTLDVYTHVMPLHEVPVDVYREFLARR
jgi:integrase